MPVLRNVRNLHEESLGATALQRLCLAQHPAVHLACADLQADRFLNNAAERSIGGTLEIMTHL